MANAVVERQNKHTKEKKDVVLFYPNYPEIGKALDESVAFLWI